MCPGFRICVWGGCFFRKSPTVETHLEWVSIVHTNYLGIPLRHFWFQALISVSGAKSSRHIRAICSITMCLSDYVCVSVDVIGFDIKTPLFSSLISWRKVQVDSSNAFPEMCSVGARGFSNLTYLRNSIHLSLAHCLFVCESQSRLLDVHESQEIYHPSYCALHVLRPSRKSGQLVSVQIFVATFREWYIVLSV